MREPVKRIKLYEAMKSDIASGVYLSGAFLPNEFELSDRYGYSRDTVRSALTMLEDDKLVELLKGKGRQICPGHVEKAKVPLTFLLPCADFLSETFPHVTAQSCRQMLKGVSQIAFECDYRLETIPVSPTNNAHEIDWRKLDFVNADSRLIITGYWYRDLFPLLLERGCRVAFANRQVICRKDYENFINNCFCITVDAFKAAEDAVMHLFKRGCRRIALFHHYISEPEHPTMCGYLSGLRKCGLKFSAWHEIPDEIPGECPKQENVRSQLNGFYKKSGGFDGLLISPELSGLRLRNLYQGLGLNEEIKIISSDDMAGNQWATPSISSMAFPHEEIGRIMARHLLVPDFSPEELLISAKFIERESTLTTKLVTI